MSTQDQTLTGWLDIEPVDGSQIVDPPPIEAFFRIQFYKTEQIYNPISQEIQTEYTWLNTTLCSEMYST